MDPVTHFEEISRRTRIERYKHKKRFAEELPVDIACINFTHDGNLAFIIRAAACFGVKNLYVIGSVPERSELKRLSGSTVDFVEIKSFANPIDFLCFARNRGLNLISAELSERAVFLEDYTFNFDKNNCVVLGHETTGVPEEIMWKSEVVKVNMPGIGFCLNTSQTGNIFLYEASRQYYRRG